jgi:hypothetical protein
MMLLRVFPSRMLGHDNPKNGIVMALRMQHPRGEVRVMIDNHKSGLLKY